MSPSADEHELIAKIVAGDQDAMDNLACRYRSDIVSRLNAEGVSDQDHGDIVQEVLSAAFSQIKRGIFRGDSSVRTWISTIARGKAIDHKRSLFQRQRNLTDSVDALSTVRNAPSELARTDDHERNFLVRQALNALTPQERTMLKLKEMDGYTVREIATLSGLPEKRIYRLLQRARERFRQEISGEKVNRSRLIE
jgi:RNA polymerase sigma-70 factor (ECF subfamily)